MDFTILSLLVYLLAFFLSIFFFSYGFYIIAEHNNPFGFVVFVSIILMWKIILN